MKTIPRTVVGLLCLGVLFLLGAAQSPAQQRTNDLRAGYDPAKEVTLLGTISSFIPSSPTGPVGAHVALQTAGGAIDVHVGTEKFLELNHLTLNAGDSVRIIGESFTIGDSSIFLARIIQKGTTAVAVRSPKGMPLWPSGSRTQQTQGVSRRGGAQ